jgi:hypothetical protein
MVQERIVTRLSLAFCALAERDPET